MTDRLKKNGGDQITPIEVGDPRVLAASLAIDQAHLEDFLDAGAKSSVVQCRRPPKGHFFTVPVEAEKPWRDRRLYFVLELEGRDPHIVAPAIAKQKRDEGEDTIRPVLLVRYVTMVGEEGLWPVKLDRPDGRSNRWNASAHNILNMAGSEKWVWILSSDQEYRYQVSKKTLEEVPPRFTNRPFDDLVDSAFHDRIITGLDHPLWAELADGSAKK